MPQGSVQAVACHNISGAPKNLSRRLLHIHELIKPQLALLIVEEEVDIGFLVCFVTRRGAEHVKTFDAKAFQIGGMRLETAYGFITLHCGIIARRNRKT